MARPKKLSEFEACCICNKANWRYKIRLDDIHKEEFVKKALICVACYNTLFRKANN